MKNNNQQSKEKEAKVYTQESELPDDYFCWQPNGKETQLRIYDTKDRSLRLMINSHWDWVHHDEMYFKVKSADGERHDEIELTANALKELLYEIDAIREKHDWMYPYKKSTDEGFDFEVACRLSERQCEKWNYDKSNKPIEIEIKRTLDITHKKFHGKDKDLNYATHLHCKLKHMDWEQFKVAIFNTFFVEVDEETGRDIERERQKRYNF